jgi:gluconate 2-dehydrogenase gamma chain
MTDATIARRKFLWHASVAGVAGAGLAGAAASTVSSGAHAQNAPPQAPASSSASSVSPAQPEPPLQYLNEDQHAFVIAAVDTLIPADELSPSGSDCGCATYIDRQLASAWGGGAKMYRGGPFLKGKPEQGYQLPLTPAEFLVAGIAAANDWTRKTYGADFERLGQDKRVEALKAMEEGRIQQFQFTRFFRAAPCHDNGRVFCRSDLRRQSQHGVVAHARLSRPTRDLCQAHRSISR